MQEREIKERAKELCRNFSRCNQYQIKERNDKIIRILQNEFDIDYEYARKCFENCNN